MNSKTIVLTFIDIHNDFNCRFNEEEFTMCDLYKNSYLHVLILFMVLNVPREKTHRRASIKYYCKKERNAVEYVII